MKKFRKVYLPSLAITFMLASLISAIFNIQAGNNQNGYFTFIFQLLGYLICIEIIDYLLSKVNFKNYITYFITGGVIYYAIFMGCGYIFHWFGFQITNIIYMTMMFVAVCGFIQYHFYRLFQQEAKEINEILRGKNNV